MPAGWRGAVIFGGADPAFMRNLLSAFNVQLQFQWVLRFQVFSKNCRFLPKQRFLFGGAKKSPGLKVTVRINIVDFCSNKNSPALESFGATFHARSAQITAGTAKPK